MTACDGRYDVRDPGSAGLAFRRCRGGRSLSEVHASIKVPQGGIWLRRFLAFAGPGYLVTVGYMDPGNWATDLEGGSRYGYTLLCGVCFPT